MAPKAADLRNDTPAVEEVCETLPVDSVDMTEVFRLLGYPHGAVPKPANKKRIESFVEEALPLLKPRGAYRLYPVTSLTARSMEIAGITISGAIGEFLDQSKRVAVLVATAGKEISDRSQLAAREGDAFAAWVMDAVGSWAAESAADSLMMRIRSHLQADEDLTLRYSPGYCGMHIGQQKKLFELLPADGVGVRLLPAMLMHPLKSVSGVVGLAPREAVAKYRSPCDRCPKTDCHMRRTS